VVTAWPQQSLQPNTENSVFTVRESDRQAHSRRSLFGRGVGTADDSCATLTMPYGRCFAFGRCDLDAHSIKLASNTAAQRRCGGAALLNQARTRDGFANTRSRLWLQDEDANRRGQRTPWIKHDQRRLWHGVQIRETWACRYMRMLSNNPRKLVA